MEEIQHICTNIAIIDHGKLIAEGKIKDILEKYSVDNIINIQFNSSIDKTEINLIKRLEGVKNVLLKDSTIIIENDKNINNLDKIICHLTERNLIIRNIEKKHMDLETIFLNLTGKSLRD